jgi:inhibitor of cysteine peptidase
VGAPAAADAVTGACEGVITDRAAPGGCPVFTMDRMGASMERGIQLTILACLVAAFTILGPLRPAAGERMTFDDPFVPITVKAGEEFAILLDSNRTTGYQWELAPSFDGKMLRLIKSEYQAPYTDRVGAGGKEVWLFAADAEGETTLSFRYIRPWEKDLPPAKAATFQVLVGP